MFICLLPIGVNYKFVRRLAYQLFEHLDYLRSKNIVHLDLKPENILLQVRRLLNVLSKSMRHIHYLFFRFLQDEASVKIVVIDFGSSCMSNQNPFTYVQSRFYRSPEVLLGCPYGELASRYFAYLLEPKGCSVLPISFAENLFAGHEVDMWSVACILPEMRSSLPIFPGRDEIDQMGCIVECLGMPPPEMIEKGGRKNRFFDARDRLLKGKQKSSHNQAHSQAQAQTPSNAPELSSRVPGSKTIAQLSKAKSTPDDVHLMSLLAACFKWNPRCVLFVVLGEVSINHIIYSVSD
jgi:serine/threonine protein kinase